MIGTGTSRIFMSFGWDMVLMKDLRKDGIYPLEIQKTLQFDETGNLLR